MLGILVYIRLLSNSSLLGMINYLSSARTLSFSVKNVVALAY